jgi:hypothetical protein
MSEDLVLLELNARWNCDLPFGWVPITGPAAKSDELEIYNLDPFVDWFSLGIKQIIADAFGISFIYKIQEGGAVNYIPLDDCVFGYTGLEHMYTDVSFQFLLYYSHEDSVTAGGRMLLEAIHQKWPDYSRQFWPPASWL